MKSIIIKLVISVVMLLPLLTTTRTIQWNESSPVPTPWPEQFHALLFMNLTSSGHLQVSNLWYDWPSGKNVNIIQKQLGVLLYDVEWDNGTSFYYTLTPGGANVEYYCEIMHFEVGILGPNWLDGATYLGTQYTDGFLCNVWEKVDFIVYYEDVVTNTPVRWDFYDGISTHVMTYEVGAVLEDSQVQAPSYCFGADKSQHVNRDGLPKFDTRKLHLKSSSNI